MTGTDDTAEHDLRNSHDLMVQDETSRREAFTHQLETPGSLQPSLFIHVLKTGRNKICHSGPEAYKINDIKK